MSFFRSSAVVAVTSFLIVSVTYAQGMNLKLVEARYKLLERIQESPDYVCSNFIDIGTGSYFSMHRIEVDEYRSTSNQSRNGLVENRIKNIGSEPLFYEDYMANDGPVVYTIAYSQMEEDKVFQRADHFRDEKRTELIGTDLISLEYRNGKDASSPRLIVLRKQKIPLSIECKELNGINHCFLEVGTPQIKECSYFKR